MSDETVPSPAKRYTVDVDVRFGNDQRVTMPFTGIEAEDRFDAAMKACRTLVNMTNDGIDFELWALRVSAYEGEDE